MSVVDGVKVNGYGLLLGHELPDGNARQLEHLSAGNHFRLLRVLVGEVNDLLDAGLDDDLGALVAGEEGDVDLAALDVGRVLVEDGVHLGVADVHVLVLQPVGAGLAPGKVVVAAPSRHPVVADTNDAVLGIDNDGSHLDT